MVEFEDARDAGDVCRKVRDLLEIGAQLDEWRRTEAVRVHYELAMLEGVEIGLDQHEVGAGLYGQETATRNVDSVAVLKVTDRSTDGGLELDDRDVGLSLLISGNGLCVGDDLHFESVLLHNTLDSAQVHPDVVGVEVLELLDRLELVDVLLGDLGNFQKTCSAVVVNDGTTLDISLGLVSQFHDVL